MCLDSLRAGQVYQMISASGYVYVRAIIAIGRDSVVYQNKTSATLKRCSHRDFLQWAESASLRGRADKNG